MKKGIDPVKFRLELLHKSPRAVKVVRARGEMANWGRKRERPRLGFAILDYSGSQSPACRISLDRRSGQIRAHEFWCAIDCGSRGAADNIRSQTEAAQSMAWVGPKRTHQHQGRRGRAVELLRLPGAAMNEVPLMHIEVIQTDNHPHRRRADVNALVAPAISNAWAAAHQCRLRHTPFTSDRVKRHSAKRSDIVEGRAYFGATPKLDGRCSGTAQRIFGSRCKPNVCRAAHRGAHVDPVW